MGNPKRWPCRSLRNQNGRQLRDLPYLNLWDSLLQIDKKRRAKSAEKGEYWDAPVSNNDKKNLKFVLKVVLMNCGLCGSVKNIFVFSSARYKIVKCAECGLMYTEDFTKGRVSYSGDEYFTQQNQYVNRWDEFCFMLQPLLDKIVRFKRGGKLLDIGAGVGVLMFIAAKCGFLAKGVEISEWASAFARDKKGLDVLTGTLETARLTETSFDVVTINHVLEHVEFPGELLKNVRRLLKADGLLVIGVPNIGSFMARLRRGKWLSLRPDEHIWHFSPETLKRLVNRAGFEVVYFESKENNAASSWGPAGMMRRVINRISMWTDRSEAMLVFARKV